MKIRNKKDYAFFLSLLVLLGFFVFLGSVWGLQIIDFDRPSTDMLHETNRHVSFEKIVIHSAVYNPIQNSVSLYVQAMNDFSRNATLSGLSVKNVTGTITYAPMSETLNGFELTTFTVNLNSALTSGTYTVTLVTTRGGSYVSPSFKVP